MAHSDQIFPKKQGLALAPERRNDAVKIGRGARGKGVKVEEKKEQKKERRREGLLDGPAVTFRDSSARVQTAAPVDGANSAA